MKLDPKWSFVLTVLLFAGMMIGLSLSVLNDFMAQTTPLAGRDIFVMAMHVIWLALWSVATVFALKYALQPNENDKRRSNGLTSVRRSPNPATSEY